MIQPSPSRAHVHATDQLNTALAGRYTVDRRIGEGGMATVYLARDLRHNRKVALKVLKPDLGAVVGEERFLAEIQVTANLQHPNLLPLFDSGASDGLFFYVMPFVEGESLRVRLDREKQLPVDEAIRMATAIGAALDYAHRHGVIHRDLKPENILLVDDMPLVADFGIALAVSNAGGNRITQTGLSLGTPQYMSPEQATGDRAIDGRTDIYSLGALTYEMLTGEPPHTGNTSQAVIARVLTEKPRSIRVSRPSVPEEVEEAVERALEKLPADRWATAREFCDALNGRIATRSNTLIGSSGRRAKRQRVGLREAIAWTLVLVSMGSAGTLAVRKPVETGYPRHFQLTVADSVVATARGSSAPLQISWDGRTMVFQAERPGSQPSLYVRTADDVTAQLIRGTDGARSPALSPDGSEVLFSAISGSTAVRRVGVSGGSARTAITESAANGQVSWGDAGVFVFGRDRSIWRMPEAGGAATMLAAPDSARKHRSYGFPSVLPGSKAALITIWRGDIVPDSMYVGVISLEDGKVTELGVRGAYPRYSGTGHLMYVTTEAWLYARPFDAKRLRLGGEAFPVVQGVRLGGGGAAAYSVARDGTLLYMAGDFAAGMREIVAVDRRGRERALSNRQAGIIAVRASPDGKQLALTIPTAAVLAAPNPDIWRLDLASGTLTRVTTDSASIRAEWIDNERLLYVRVSDSSVYQIPLYASASPTRVLSVQRSAGLRDNMVGQVVAPRGRGAHYVLRVGNANAGNPDLLVAHRDSLIAPRALSAEAYAEVAAALSPDGQYVAYGTNRTGTAAVYVRRLDGVGGETQISPGSGFEPVWSRDGSELFYRGNGFFWSAKLALGPRVSVVRRDSLFADQSTYARSSFQAMYDLLPTGEFVILRAAGQQPGGGQLFVKTNWHLRPDADRRR